MAITELINQILSRPAAEVEEKDAVAFQPQAAIVPDRRHRY